MQFPLRASENGIYLLFSCSSAFSDLSYFEVGSADTFHTFIKIHPKKESNTFITSLLTSTKDKSNSL